jgi:DNA-binding MarR family transcriptional regulator/GNAT superfamily N-acetyltransferase
MTTIMQKSETISITNKIRRFNRFYTRQLGLLDEQLLDSPFSLTQARVIYELANTENCTASALKNELGLDAGQLSRMLRDFESRKLISKKRDSVDARQVFLSLTAKGKKEFHSLNMSSEKQILSLLAKLNSAERKLLVNSMTWIESILNKDKTADRSYILRSPQPGDFGWVIQKNGEVYAEEYQWNEEYEALVAEIVANYIKNYDPKRERCWIAEKDGQNIGCIFLVKKDKTTAQLRILLVDPKDRGLGLGQRLVNECTRFARQAGYKKIALWTNSVLTAARHIYEKEGYKLVKSEPHNAFGHDLVSQTWELDLSVPPA